jgi:hypothetical protein
MDLFSKQWTDHIIEQLEKDEIINGRPKCMGLLRIAEKYCDNLEYHFDCKKCPTNEDLSATVNCFIACVELYEDVEHKHKIEGRSGFHTNSLCDVNSSNNPKFCKYSVATASTMALGRSLKLLLGLNILTAEEIGQPDDNNSNSNAAEDTQIRAIVNTAKKIGINLDAILKSEFKTSEAELRELSDKYRKKIISRLRSFQKDSEEIPSEYK